MGTAHTHTYIMIINSRSCQTLQAACRCHHHLEKPNPRLPVAAIVTCAECVLSLRSLLYRNPSQMQLCPSNPAPHPHPRVLVQPNSGQIVDNRTSTLNMKSQDSGGQQLTHRSLADTITTPMRPAVDHSRHRLCRSRRPALHQLLHPRPEHRSWGNRQRSRLRSGVARPHHAPAQYLSQADARW